MLYPVQLYPQPSDAQYGSAVTPEIPLLGRIQKISFLEKAVPRRGKQIILENQ